jgi:hypothetical protein
MTVEAASWAASWKVAALEVLRRLRPLSVRG